MIFQPNTVLKAADLNAAFAGKATPADIQAAINALLDAAPGQLDTLKELAQALGDDPNFAATVAAQIATKADAAAVASQLSSKVSAEDLAGALGEKQDTVPQASQEEMDDALETEPRLTSPVQVRTAAIAALQSVAGTLLSDAIPGTTRMSMSPLPAPEWLRCGGTYLISAYPKTEAKLRRWEPTTVLSSLPQAQLTQSPVSVEISSQDDRVVCLMPNLQNPIKAFDVTGGTAVALPVTGQPTWQGNLYPSFARAMRMTPDGRYFVVCGCAQQNTEPYVYYGLSAIFARTETGYAQRIYRTSESTYMTVASALTPDGTTLFHYQSAGVLHNGYLRAYSFNGSTLTEITPPLDQLPPYQQNIQDMAVSPDGNWLVMTFVSAQSSPGFPGYAIYKRSNEGIFELQIVPESIGMAQYSRQLGYITFSSDSKRVGVVFNSSSASSGVGAAAIFELGDVITVATTQGYNNYGYGMPSRMEFLSDDLVVVFGGSYVTYNKRSGAGTWPAIYFAATNKNFWMNASYDKSLRYLSNLDFCGLPASFSIESPLSSTRSPLFEEYIRSYD